MTTGFNDNKGGETAKKQGFWGKGLSDSTKANNDSSVEEEPSVEVDDGTDAAHVDFDTTAGIPLVFLDDQSQSALEINDDVTESVADSKGAEDGVSGVAYTGEEGTYPDDRYLGEDDVLEDAYAEQAEQADQAEQAHASSEQEHLEGSEGAGAPELLWDDEDSSAEQPFFGGTPSAYSNYIEDSPAYEATPNVYDQADDSDYEGFDRKNLIRVLVVIAAIVIALVIVFILGVLRFSNRYLPNTSVNGLDVSGLTVEEAQQALEQQTADYTCTLTVGDFSTTVNGSDIGIERDEDRMASQSMEGQSPYFWPVALIIRRPIEIDAGIKFDEEKANDSVTKAAEEKNEQSLPTDNASIEYDESAGLYKVTGTTEGIALDAKAVASNAIAGIRSFETQVSPAPEEVTHSATVTDIPSYVHTAESANRDRSTDIPITVDGESVIVSDAAQNASWITVGSGPKINVDEEAVRFWAEGYVADAVYHDDDWSYYALDQEAFVKEFCKRLSEGVVEPFEAPTTDELKTEGESREKAYQKGGWNSELGRYIDVDLESQFARLFDEKGEVIWESAFVSGSMYEGHSTVTGEFEIYSMQTNTVLVGMDYNGDGYPDYESFVNYWMPFYGGYGLHDATWRASFGGENYYYGGSHGCVNLPYSKAAELYEITHVGEKVNVHW